MEAQIQSLIADVDQTLTQEERRWQERKKALQDRRKVLEKLLKNVADPKVVETIEAIKTLGLG